MLNATTEEKKVKKKLKQLKLKRNLAFRCLVWARLCASMIFVSCKAKLPPFRIIIFFF